jgi:hypothetical protein
MMHGKLPDTEYGAISSFQHCCEFARFPTHTQYLFCVVQQRYLSEKLQEEVWEEEGVVN